MFAFFAEKKKAVIEAAKKRAAEKAKLTKSMIVLDVKPWDDTTGTPAPFRQLHLGGWEPCSLYPLTIILCLQTLFLGFAAVG